MIRRFLEFAGPLGFIRALFFAAIVAGSSVATAEASPAAINPRPSSVVGLEPTLAAVAPAGGPIAGGTTITLTGTNLGGAIEVTVGGVAATDLIVLDETTLTAVTPSGAVGARDVAVTTPSGTATLVGAFTYVTVPVWATVVEPLPDPAVVTSGSLRAAILATGFPWRVRDNATNIEMVLIPPGTFNMGCSASNQFGCSSGENPVHAVTLTNAFYMGRYEVTQAQWTARMGSNPSFAQTASAQVPLEQVSSRPVEQVTWNIVQRFLASTGMRLPTEAEWEYAYRAGTTTAFHGWPAQTSGTNDEALVGDIAWFSGNSTSQSRPVGGKAPNGFGLYDMAGNVFEWVNDWYSGTYYASSPSTNPPGPATGTLRVARGGGWDYSSDWMRSSFRPWLAPGNWWKSVGFRVVRSLSGTAPTVTNVSPASGPTTGGTLITITGENLLNTTSVLIDGRAATAVTVVSSTVVSAVTPSGLSLGAKDILVTTPGGVAIAAGAFTYTAPAPTITSIAPSFGPVIGGTPITISGTALTGATSVTVGGAPATNVTVVSATTVTAVTPPGVPGSAVISITTPTGTATAAGLFFYADVTDWATVLEVAPDPAVVTNATLRSAIIASGFPWRVRDNLTQIEMLLVPPGSFTMGCSASAQFNCGGSETPLRTVTLTNPFYLGRYEVTQAQWTARTGSNPSGFPNSTAEVPAAQVPNRPVERVSWNMAQGFLSLAGLRLPTEAEWEYACRAGTTTAFHSAAGFPSGTNDDSQIGAIAWYWTNSAGQPRPVGLNAANGLGLHDMAGNVWEWTNDWFGTYASANLTNPVGPTTGSSRVLRGGSWSNTSYYQRSSNREANSPDLTVADVGFRVARSIVPSPTLTNVSPTVGLTSGGTTITLTGTNLLGASSVTVGGALATNMTVVSATTITAVTPAGTPGSKSVVVTTVGGQALLANAFTHVATPTLTSVSPSIGSVSGGTVITLTGTNLSGLASVSVGGVAASGVTVLSNTTARAVTPPGVAGAVAVSATNLAGTATLANGFTYSSSPTWYTVLTQDPDPAVVTDATLRSAIIATGLPWRVRDNSTQIEMLLIPPGTFNMGCSPSLLHGCAGEENPVHTVTLTNPFYMGRYEVTQSQWTSWMGSNPSTFKNATAEVPTAQVPNRPVERVSWDMIQGFVSSSGLRLPSEAEWEYAYRAGTTTAFHSMPGFASGTNDDALVGAIAWLNSNSTNQTRPVGGRAANALGLHDMSGNVWEWVNDGYSDNYYASSPTINPAGPPTSTARVLRGGSFFDDTYWLRASRRLINSPDWVEFNRGFRVARTAATPPVILAVLPSAGPPEGGTTITITGVNLSDASSVTIGGAPVTSFTVVDSTTVTAVTPAGALGAASVALTTPHGTVTIPNAFFYYPSPTWATIIEFLPNPSVVTSSTLRDAIVATGLPWRVRDNASQVEMLLVPPSTFSMGCSASTTDSCVSDESPVHPVTLTKAFYIGRYEVTQAQWTARMGSNPSAFQGSGYPNASNRPVEQVSWLTVQNFLSATGLRLPTEAEWECAFRGGTTTAYHSMPGYPNGTNDTNLLGVIAWSGNQTGVVGQRAANSLGLHDMSGNVWEWVNDWYLSTYYNVSSSVDPPGPASGSVRVRRGGGWGPNYNGGNRASQRTTGEPTLSASDVGFRVARTAVAPVSIDFVTPAAGPTAGGTTITIVGANLVGATSVTIGGNAATDLVVIDSSTIRATVPAGVAGAATVAVTTAIGVGTLDRGFTYAQINDWATILEFEPDPAVVEDASLRARIIATGFPWRVRDNLSQAEMLLVPPGSFTMGCSASSTTNCAGVENPTHAVTLTSPFYIGRYEVTQAQWTARMGSNPSNFQSTSAEVPAAQIPNRPVERVTWNAIQGFLTSTGLRLPTEAEWEYAYRADTTTAYHSMPGFPTGTSNSNQAGAIAWFGSNSSNQTRPVGQKSANGLGLHDMSGNVWEWVGDWYLGTYYSSSPMINPPGPETGSSRVLRGGSWGSSSGSIRSSSRNSQSPELVSPLHGFRVARWPANPPLLAAVVPSVGSTSGGTPIVLTGSGLFGATSVNVGGAAATNVVVVSSTRVTAVAPPGTLGTKDVSVTTPNGIATLPNGFTYVAPWFAVLEQDPDPTVVTDTALRSAIIATGLPWRVRDTTTQIEMLLVPPGTFSMGCSASSQDPCSSDETPVRAVTLTQAFYIGRYEVTQTEWRNRVGSNPSYFQGANYPDAANRPVEQVSWNSAKAFVDAAGLRLPTEAEWEYAYRAGTSTAFHGWPIALNAEAAPNGTNDGNRISVFGWFVGNNGEAASPGFGTKVVGQLAGNGLGLHDMAGNVAEYTDDWLGTYPSGPATNPTGPSTGFSRVFRGGSWFDQGERLRASARAGVSVFDGTATRGIRVARWP